MNENHHRFEVRDNAEILKVVNCQHKLDAWESYFISKETNTIKRDEGPLTSYFLT